MRNRVDATTFQKAPPQSRANSMRPHRREKFRRKFHGECKRKDKPDKECQVRDDARSINAALSSKLRHRVLLCVSRRPLCRPQARLIDRQEWDASTERCRQGAAGPVIVGGAFLKICVVTQRAEVAKKCALAAHSVACSTTFIDRADITEEKWGRFDLIAVDKSMPGAGVFVPGLRNLTPAFILFLVGRSRIGETASLIEAGADQVLSDDLDDAELKAHFLAVSRHKGARAKASALVAGEFVLDRDANIATWRGQRIDFGSQRVLQRLFVLLFENAGECVSHDAIWREGWPQSKLAPNPQTIQRTVFRLRRLLRDISGLDHLQTVRGEGYRFLAATGRDLGRYGEAGSAIDAVDPVRPRTAWLSKPGSAEEPS